MWDSIFIPVMDIIFDGKKVMRVEVDYTNPAKQTEIEENDPTFLEKREKQLQTLKYALKRHWNKLHPNK